MNTILHLGFGKQKAERGSAMIIVIILCGFTLILLGSYLKTLHNTSRISYRSTLQNEGRNAAEGVSEYVLAEMHRRSQANPTFGAAAYPNPLTSFTLSTADRNFIAPGTGYSRVVPSSIGFKNSVFSDPAHTPVAIDATDPVNAQDPTVDQTPKAIRSLNIFAKAAVLDPQTNTQIKSFVATNVQIRDQTWFNYAIFYNMDMEFHAGPNFTVYGPVHTNATAYMTAGGGNKLQFFSTLTAVGKLNRFDKYTGDTTTASHTGTVESSSKTGMLAGDLKVMATNRDSNYGTFHDFAIAQWNSFVQDSTFSVSKFNPPGMKAYVPENYATAAVELRNNGYLMIEPQLSQVAAHIDPYTGISDYGYKGLDSENLKFSALSGFVIQVKPPTAIGRAPQWQLVCYRATNPSQPLSAGNPPERDATTGLPIIDCVINPFTDKDDVDYPLLPPNPAALAVIKRSLKIDLLNAIVAIPYRDGGTDASNWGNGTSNLTAYTQLPPTGTINEGSSPTFTTALNGTHYPIYDRREGHDYTTSGGDTWIAMKGAMHVIKIDLAKLNALLTDTTGKWRKPYGSTDYVYNPTERYTGVVYVQFPLAPLTASRFPPTTTDGDMIRPAISANASASPKRPGYAVVVANATTVPQLPAEIPDGFTIATNTLLYVWGHFNADGLPGTGSSTLPDSTSERPALIAADAVTVLSSGFTDFSGMATANLTASSFTEVSSAILTGIIPTRPGVDQIWSGGVHNLVRLLETWTGNYRFRGSLGVLFESEVAKGKYHEGHNPFYGAPTRDMGYHQYLSQGRFPPATPINRTIRRMNLRDITEAEYNAGPTKPPAFN